LLVGKPKYLAALFIALAFLTGGGDATLSR